MYEIFHATKGTSGIISKAKGAEDAICFSVSDEDITRYVLG